MAPAAERLIREENMKSGIHPQYHTVTVACACGNSFVTRSTASQIRLEICSNCHPFYTGRQKLLDTAGRVERFAKRYASTAAAVKKVNTVLRTAPKITILPKGAKPKGSKPQGAKAPAKTPAPAGK